MNEDNTKFQRRQMKFDLKRNGSDHWETQIALLFESEIQSLLQRKQYTLETAKGCFADNSELVAALVDGGLPKKEAENYSEHLLACDQCFESVSDFAHSLELDIACESEATPCSTRIPSDLSFADRVWLEFFVALELRRDGLTMFPDGTIADGAWEFGRLLEAEAFKSVLSCIAEQLALHVKSKFSNKILLVAFSDPMHAICVIAAGILKSKSEGLDINVVSVKSADEPLLLCKPKLCKGAKVVLVTDLVRNGNLLESLWKIVTEKEPAKITAFTLINQNYQGKHKNALHALARQPKSLREVAAYSGEEYLGLRYFDPASGKSRQDAPCIEAEPWCVGDIKDLMPLVIQTRALKRNHKIGNTVYPYTIDVVDLLKNQSVKEKLAPMAQKFCKTLDPLKNWVFVFPASRSDRAGRVAKLLSSVSGRPNISLGNLGDSSFFDLTPEENQLLRDCDGIVVVDAAIRSGSTLRSQLDVLNRFEGKMFRSFYVLDLRRPRDRDALSNEFDIEVSSLFEVPFGFAPATVRKLLKTRFEPLSTAICDTRYSGYVKELLSGFYDRMFGCQTDASGKRIEVSKIEETICKGTQKSSKLLEDIAVGNRVNVSLTGFLAGEATLKDESLRRDIAYMIHNAESPRMLRELALTMTAHGDYRWFSKYWLLLHECLFNTDSNWDFLAAIAFDATQTNPNAVLHMRNALCEYEQVVVDRSREKYLFDCSPALSRVQKVCGVLQKILAKPCSANELLVSK